MLRGESESNDGGTKPRQQLFIILDDWEEGYTVRKVDLDTDQLILGCCKEREAASCLPPPLVRLGARLESPIYFSDAIGSKILATHPKEEGSPDRGVICFDVHDKGLNCIPRHTHQLRPIYFPIGNRLFALGEFSMELLDLQPLVSGSQMDDMSWCKLPDAPFDSMFVFSHAILPDKQTIFVSVGITTNGTYSFHMAEDGSFKWESHGEWILPFDGRGYFDPELDTWVGLAIYKEEPGRICSCKLASAASKQRPEVKYSQEYLFSEDPAETHVGATLVYMGHNSKYCLVEGIEVPIKDEGLDNFEQENGDLHVRYMFRLTTFSLKLDKNGDLMIGESRWVRYYKVSSREVNRLFFLWPQAFWL